MAMVIERDGGGGIDTLVSVITKNCNQYPHFHGNQGTQQSKHHYSHDLQRDSTGVIIAMDTL